MFFFSADGLTPIEEKRMKSAVIQDFAAGSDNSHYPTLEGSNPFRHKNKNTTLMGGIFVWWAFGDSNPGPSGYEPDALTN